jgi:hypothetical protein
MAQTPHPESGVTGALPGGGTLGAGVACRQREKPGFPPFFVYFLVLFMSVAKKNPAAGGGRVF